MAVVRVLSESPKTLSTYACTAKSLPGGLQDFSKGRARTHGEGRERLLSFSFQYTVYSYQLTSGTSDRCRHESLHAVRPVASADLTCPVASGF